MSYNIIPIDKFKKEAKRLVRKYPSLKQELEQLNSQLQSNPTLGTSLGNNAYKVRVAVKSKGAGKSGGARVITYIVTENKEIYLLAIYDKADFETIEDNTLRRIIRNIQEGR